MSKDTWDAILASTPLNETAGRAVAKGIHYEPEAGVVTEYSWDAPPPLKDIAKYLTQPDFTDLTGRHIGRLRVLGLAAEDPKEGSAMWVCRCVCGRYIGRRTKGLKAAIRGEHEAMCNVCDHTLHLRFAASGDNARQRAESEEARKW